MLLLWHFPDKSFKVSALRASTGWHPWPGEKKECGRRLSHLGFYCQAMDSSFRWNDA